jgi:uncharacterized membrane protein
MKNENNENQILYESNIESTNQQSKLMKNKLLFLLGKFKLILLLSFFSFYVINIINIQMFLSKNQKSQIFI